MNELKPCKFCGENENIEIKIIQGEYWFNLKCHNCGATAHGMCDDDGLIWAVWEGGKNEDENN